jgi:hypothetical protein
MNEGSHNTLYPIILLKNKIDERIFLSNLLIKIHNQAVFVWYLKRALASVSGRPISNAQGAQ